MGNKADSTMSFIVTKVWLDNCLVSNLNLDTVHKK